MWQPSVCLLLWTRNILLWRYHDGLSKAKWYVQEINVWKASQFSRTFCWVWTLPGWVNYLLQIRSCEFFSRILYLVQLVHCHSNQCLFWQLYIWPSRFGFFWANVAIPLPRLMKIPSNITIGWSLSKHQCPCPPVGCNEFSQFCSAEP